ncbi:MAG: hypothetical protein ACR2FO_05430 [Actinomycetota bacterium]
MAQVKEPPETVLLIWDEAARRLEAQMGQAGTLDQKAGILLGFLGVAGTLISSRTAALQGYERWLATILIFGLTVSAGFAAEAFRTKEYDRRPSPVALWEHSYLKPEELWHLFLSTRFRALDDNGAKLTHKSKMLNISLLLLIGVTLVIAIFTIGRLWLHERCKRQYASAPASASAAPARGSSGRLRVDHQGAFPASLEESEPRHPT